MIKRDFPLVKRPLADRPYDIAHPDRFRSDGTHKPCWDYRGAVIAGRPDTERGYYVSGLGVACPPYDTLAEACDRVDEYCNRRDGQHRRIARDLAASVAQPVVPLSDVGVFVDCLGFSIGPVTVHNLLKRSIIEAHGAGIESILIGYDDMAYELVVALAQAGFEIVSTAFLDAAA